MSVRPIVLLGDPRLRLKGLPVDSFGKFLHGLLDDLTDTMRARARRRARGAAARRGAPGLRHRGREHALRADEPADRPRPTATIATSKAACRCPGYYAYVTRREKVWVVAQNRDGKKIKVAGSGLLGRALQHELDHLDGKLFIDYLDSMDELIPVGARVGRRGRRGARPHREAARALA